MNGRYTSETFYHMVGFGVMNDPSIAPEDKQDQCYERLKLVLKFGFIAGVDLDGNRVKQESIIRVSTNPKGHLRHGDFDGFLVKGDISCFADIPLECIDVHASKYGLFGFGVSARHLVRLGARPVSYVPVDDDGWMGPSYRGTGLLDNMTSEIVKLHDEVDAWEEEHNDADESGVKTIHNMHKWSGLNSVLTRDVAAFIKPYDSTLPFDHPECYYMEREWRLLGNVEIAPPKVPTIIVAKGYRLRLLEEVPDAGRFSIVEAEGMRQ